MISHFGFNSHFFLKVKNVEHFFTDVYLPSICSVCGNVLIFCCFLVGFPPFLLLSFEYSLYISDTNPLLAI